jgi:hypothetical protein
MPKLGCRAKWWEEDVFRSDYNNQCPPYFEMKFQVMNIRMQMETKPP